MMSKIFRILFAVFITVIIFFLENYEYIGEFYFYVILFWGIFDILHKKRIELIHVWNAAFAFIILSEVFASYYYYNNSMLVALKYLITANNLIFIGYVSLSKVSYYNKPIYNGPKPGNTGGLVLLISILFYTWFKSYTALNAIEYGRLGGGGGGEQEADYTLIRSIVNALGFILPALVAYYFLIIKKGSNFFAIILVLPVFIVQFLIGTRFPLLFSALGYVFVVISKHSQKKVTFKTQVILFVSVIVLFFGSKLMKDFRNQGFNTFQNDQAALDLTNEKGFAETILGLGSPEGVLDMTSLMFEHFQNHSFLYGKSSSFIFYFWVPRSVWEDKPKMLGYWFIRKYRSGFSSGHSASFGFTGELYSDFGLFSLIPVFFIGRALKIGETYKQMALKSGSYKMVLGAMLYPYTFFFVRSPITATMSFLGILFFHMVFKKILFKG